MVRDLATLVACSILVLACGCGDPAGPPGKVAAMLVVSGDAQTGVVGQELAAPLVVEVTDSAGNPVQGQLVNFVVTAGGGSVFAGSALTNSTGIARERWTLGSTPYEPQAVQARAVDPTTGAALVFANFTAVAQPPSTGVTFTAVSAGGIHSCGLTPSGQAYCWGDNGGGELGNPDTPIQATVPMPVAGGLTFTQISAGASDYTCAVTTAGKGYCWGANTYGRLGTSTTANTSSPIPVAGNLNFSAIYAGSNHTCGVTPSGAAYCWGHNDHTGGYGGQLGDGTLLDRSEPTAVIGGLIFTDLALGEDFTCGLTDAGAAYCWGMNDYGNLGNGSQGTQTNSLVPSPVAGGLTFTSITAGGVHACGLMTSGAAYCWGANEGGELGDGTTAPSSTPVAVGGALGFQTISAGFYYTCGLTGDGTPYCWGWRDDNFDSRTFNGGTSVHSVLPVALPGGHKFAGLSAGATHACAVTAQQAAYCWFANEQGELGTGTYSGSYEPLPVR